MRHRTRRIRWPVLVATGVLVVGSGTAYAVRSDRPTGSYRTAAAATGDVEQVLSTTGTVDAAHRADLEFGTAGTVARVKVALGDTVRAGQVIATLDTTALRAAVTRAVAGVARAEAQLEADENAQEQTVSDASSGPQSGKPGSGSSPGSSGTGVDPGTLAALRAQQDAVVKAQSAATAAIAAAKSALAAQTAACADAYQDTPADPTPSAEGQTTDGKAAAEPAATTADNQACSAALATVQARQDDVDAAQDTLADALTALASTLSKALATLASPGGSATPSGRARTAASSSPSSSTPSADTPTTASSSAAQLAADQASLEQARADLVDARQQLGQAVLRSTRPGRVVALDLAKGADVTAGSTVATVVGGRAVTIRATVAESKIGQVEVGERVRVTTPGESDLAEGTVTAIGLVADSSSGTASYPVTVTVEDPTIALPAGSQAMLGIVVATAHDVVTVPTSAITRRGDTASVQTWDGRALNRQVVTVGTVGAREVEITDGLSAGDVVVLADLDQAITGASDRVNDRGGFNGPPVMRFDKAGGGGPATFKSAG